MAILIGAALSSGVDDDAASNTPSSSTGDGANDSSQNEVPTSMPTISYDQIVMDTDGLTDLQFDRYAESIEGKRRADRWTATVLEVDDEVFGDGFYADLTIDPNSAFDLRERV